MRETVTADGIRKKKGGRRVLLATGGLLVAGTGAFALGAPAATAAPARWNSTVVRADGTRATTTRVGQSTSNAGWFGNLSAPTTTFSVTIKVPVFTCTARANQEVIIGAYLNGSSTGSGGSINASCSGTTPSFQAIVFGDDGASSDITVAAGDTVVFQGTAAASGETYTVTDATSAATTSATGTGLEASNIQLTTQAGFSPAGGFAKFKPISYTDITIDGTTLQALAPYGNNQVDASNHVMVRAGAVSKKGFTLKFVADS
jgi:hypothetical protein